jgi:hypothetical protein
MLAHRLKRTLDGSVEARAFRQVIRKLRRKALDELV